MAPRQLAGVALTFLVAACSSTAPASPVRSEPGPTPSAEALSPVLPAFADGAVPAGRYRLPGFEPAITVELDGSWQSLMPQDGYASLEQVSRPAGGNPYRGGTLIAIALVEGVVGDGETSVEPTTARAAVATIQTNPGVSVVETSDSRIGGLAGSQVTVERPGPPSPVLSYNVAVVLDVAPGAIGVVPSERLWIALFETRQGLVAVIVRGSLEDWDAYLAAAEPVLEEIRFEVP